MRLRKLELQGYKSFASKTEFDFNSGVTAIVGPNGSGKSNVADAIRWVLGEQSYRLLRGKRTEDMIFSGSSQRSRSGLAQVTMTLDNSEGWLPVDFNEVTIGRRALRSGENEYHLNGNRVRLRDITELLGRSGLARRTYTVIGQGLIDTALSQRPEERRALFEEAAGITIHQLKRSDALAKLEDTQSNLLRIHDIIAEIAPRLRSLRIQATRAENHARLSAELQDLFRVWYGYRWFVAQNRVMDAQAHLEQHSKVVQQRSQEIDAVEQQITALRNEQTTLRVSLGEWHRESSQIHAAAETVERELAVWQERLHQITQQIDELSQELISLNAEAQGQEERITTAEGLLAEIETERAEHATRAGDVQKQVQQQETERQQLLHTLNRAREDAFRIATDLADRRNRVAQLAERKDELQSERAGHQAQIETCQKSIGELERRVRTVKGELETWIESSALIETQRQRALEAARKAVAGRPAIEEQLDKTRETMAHLRSRQDVLARLREDMEGYYAGVRSVMRADVSGLIGPVAGQIEVESKLERAIETALGSHLQDVIVEKWEVAEEAIAYLKKTRGGRATFLPLDSLRSSRTVSAPGESGVIGTASELIDYPPALRPAIEMLLGRTLVVEDLQVARRVMKKNRDASQIVTLAGEIVRSSGAVTGGETRKSAEGGVLSREREWRELPKKLQTAENALKESQGQLEQSRKTEAAHRQTAEDLARDLAKRQTEQAQLDEQVQQIQRQQDRAAQEADWHLRLIEQLAGESKALLDKKAELEAEITDQSRRQAEMDQTIERLQAEAAELSTEDGQKQLAELRSIIASLDSKRDGQRQVIRNLRNSLQHTQGQITGKEQRREGLGQQQTDLSERIATTSQNRQSLAGRIESLEGHIQPTEVRLDELETQLTAQYTAEDRMRQRLREAESRHAQANLDLQRREDQLKNLHHQIEEDLGLVELEPVEGIVEQAPLPLHPLVSKLPVVEILPEGVEEEINRLRAALRRLGSINPEAPEEYTTALERHTFLSEQVADLEQASRSLRAVIAELDEIMERDFMQTFRAVAAQFKAYFATLFGGGSAQIVLTEPDNISSTGIDIIARPPGKRQQGLALLSGGERALTAAALVFSILKISPTPFCILDEVDAMLDEANVSRFRQSLKDLADQTQFIVITHNRGTVEVANTVYGITMGEDSTSRSISLRMDGADLENGN